VTATLTASELHVVEEQLSLHGIDLIGPLDATLIAGGRSNLTFRLEDGARQWVLRMPPRAGRTPSAHDVVREYRVTKALGHTDVPVPPAVLLCEDPSLLGGPFAVAEFVDGTTIQSRADLDSIDDTAVADLVGQLVLTLATLHRVDHIAIGLERFGRPDGYAARQVNRWATQWTLVGDSSPVQDLAVSLTDRLASLVPAQTASGIVHGDFRIDNTLLELAEFRVAAVVDWELSTIGDPVADVAMMCAYRHPAFDLIVGEPSAWTSLRIPDADDLAAAYESAGGVSLVAWDYHLALAYFKIAVIAAGIDHRFRAGVGDGPGFDSSGHAVPEFFEASDAALARFETRVGA
jgi:aminoglycoside phosphotransferase (APT) family kinase protein